MKEATYTAALARDIEKEIGGKIIKISDRSTLGLPDLMHIKDGIITYIETKIGSGAEIINEIVYTQPWKSVLKDLRQFEVCKSISKHALVLYSIYYPEIKTTAIISIEMLESFRKRPGGHFINQNYVITGRGIPQLKWIMESNRKEIANNVLSSTDAE